MRGRVGKRSDEAVSGVKGKALGMRSGQALGEVGNRRVGARRTEHTGLVCEPATAAYEQGQQESCRFHVMPVCRIKQAQLCVIACQPGMPMQPFPQFLGHCDCGHCGHCGHCASCLHTSPHFSGATAYTSSTVAECPYLPHMFTLLPHPPGTPGPWTAWTLRCWKTQA